MLVELQVKNIVLIKDLSINFQKGFTVFTGETGSGKSILLDSLSLALGERANYNLIGSNSNFAEVIAIFDNINSNIVSILKEAYIPIDDDTLILRRVITSDFKTKCYINDISVSVTFLRKIGDFLVDIHGQFDNYKLLDSNNYINILDKFLDDKAYLIKSEDLYNQYCSAVKDLENMQKTLNEIKQEEEYILYVLQELEDFNPLENEEEELLVKKKQAQNTTKINNIIKELDKLLIQSSINSEVGRIINYLNNQKDITSYYKEFEGLEKNLLESYDKITEAIESFLNIQKNITIPYESTEDIDKRLMDLRHLASKHKVLSTELPKVMKKLKEKLDEISSSDETIIKLTKIVEELEVQYNDVAKALSEQRIKAAKYLNEKVMKELYNLKLNNAQFLVEVTQGKKSSLGYDLVNFKLQTNLGGAWGDLNKMASGGEMSRIMLALKIALAEVIVVPTIILDEIDIGVGGEIANSIGARLQYLSNNIQTVVVTHSHQVAAKGIHHFAVRKSVNNSESTTETTVFLLNMAERIDEIARMLSGDTVTPEAKSTAINLLNLK